MSEHTIAKAIEDAQRAVDCAMEYKKLLNESVTSGSFAKILGWVSCG
jgi:hypothetical protein